MVNQGKKELLKNVSLNLLAEGKTIRIKASGYSMYPCIKPGSVILIESLKEKGKPRPGEIIAIRRGNGLIVHRLVKTIMKDGIEYFVARGDSNSREDEPVKLGMIAGRVVSTEISMKNTDIRSNTKPSYFRNRLRVIWIILWKKIGNRLR
ncbi:MAG TPA: S24/S26 family peptidase [Bacteroidales bacterium]|nr:S24/S26 family peptidase [Bacteroidales bacterium]